MFNRPVEAIVITVQEVCMVFGRNFGTAYTMSIDAYDAPPGASSKATVEKLKTVLHEHLGVPPSHGVIRYNLNKSLIPPVWNP